MDELQVIIIRDQTSDQGTEGVFAIPGVGFSCFSMELPWRDNNRNISCVPQGSYEAQVIFSQKFGTVYLIIKVPGRDGILMHSGNYAGDRARGYKTHSYGCILLGKWRGTIGGQAAVLYSRPTMYKMMKLTAGKRLKLTIRGII